MTFSRPSGSFSPWRGRVFSVRHASARALVRSRFPSYRGSSRTDTSRLVLGTHHKQRESEDGHDNRFGSVVGKFTQRPAQTARGTSAGHIHYSHCQAKGGAYSDPSLSIETGSLSRTLGVGISCGSRTDFPGNLRRVRFYTRLLLSLASIKQNYPKRKQEVFRRR